MGYSKKDKISVNQKSQKDVSKENGLGGKLAGTPSIEKDPKKIETMTVQELRAALRNVGASSKGRKEELVSALKAVMDGGNDVNGNSSTLEKEVASIQESVQGSAAISEASKRLRSKRKEKHVDDEHVEVNADIKKVKQSTSVEATDLSGKKRSVKGKAIVETASFSVEVSEGLDETSYGKEPWTTLAHKKPQKGWIAYNPRTLRPPPLTRDTNFVKLMSWNVNGLRALLKLEGFSALQLAQREDFDILCLQETKLQEKDVETVKNLLEGYESSFWTCSVAKAGYSGTAIVSRIKPLSVQYGLGISDHDTEGRLVTAEFDSFYLLCVYVPNSGDGLKRLDYRITQWDPSLSQYIKELEKSKPVILTGDLNCAHQEIDIFNPAGNKRSAGFTIEERQSFDENFLSKGFVDTFRKQHPNAVGYTYWGYRHGLRKTNKGWRLDYFLVSESISDRVHDSYILPDVNGSDHCPIGLVLKL